MTVNVSYVPTEPRPSLRGGIQAAVEVGLMMAVSFVTAILVQPYIVPGIGQSLVGTGGKPDLWGASAAMLQQFAAQYGALLVLVAAIGWWRGRRSARAFALTGGGRSAREIVRYGVALGLLAGIPATVLLLLQEYAPIGAEPPLWTIMRGAPKDASFWVFTASASFAVVPFLEELAWRGYVLGRYTESVAPGAAVVATAMPMALAHTQYSSLDPAMIVATFSVIALSLATTLATLRNGSVWPAMIGHAIINFPIHGVFGPAKLIGALLVVMFCWRALANEIAIWARIIWRKDTLQALPALAVFTAIMAAALWSVFAGKWIAAISLALAASASIAFTRSAWRSPNAG